MIDPTAAQAGGQPRQHSRGVQAGRTRFLRDTSSILLRVEHADQTNTCILIAISVAVPTHDETADFHTAFCVERLDHKFATALPSRGP